MNKTTQRFLVLLLNVINKRAKIWFHTLSCQLRTHHYHYHIWFVLSSLNLSYSKFLNYFFNSKLMRSLKLRFEK